jgi:hypothetical protein
MKSEKLHRGNLAGDAIVAGDGTRIWKARDDPQSIPERRFENPIRAALGELREAYYIGMMLVYGLGDCEVQSVEVEI